MTAISFNALAARDAEAEQVISRTVVLELLIKTPSFRTAIPTGTIMDDEDAADPAAFGVSKALINRDALAAIRSHRNEFLSWLRAREVPCGPLATGMHLMPLRLVEEIDARLQRFSAERAALVEQFIASYDELKSAARERLASHFDERDYPEAAALRAAFGVRARFLSLNVPAALKQMNADLYARESARVKTEFAEAFKEVQSALREGFGGLVGKLAERLTPGTDGKPQTFQATTVTNLTAFLDLFGERNITNDGELAELVSQARALLAGVDPVTLRKQETTRERVLQGFKDIETQLTVLGVTAHTRRFATGDEEV